MPTLRAVSGWPDIPEDHPTVRVGRHPQCDARLVSQWVSLRHCILTEDGGEVVVRDLGSTNGTWINGRRVERGRLKPGDEMSITHIRYRLDGAPTK
jgi:pSer/pThr/pTyr-binding forkhead associated (FHA) protein